MIKFARFCAGLYRVHMQPCSAQTRVTADDVQGVQGVQGSARTHAGLFLPLSLLFLHLNFLSHGTV